VSNGRENDVLTERIERATELPMLFLALAYIPAFAIGYFPDTSPEARGAARFVEYLIIAAFAAELIVKIAVAERRLAFVKAHWLDVVIVALPFLRPLRFLRILRFLPLLLRAARGLRRIMGPYQGAYALLIGMLSVVTAALLTLAFEEGVNPEIANFGDALWWAFVTITTVGYGDISPVTSAGRAVAVYLMIVGIALFGIITAAVAAFFVESSASSEEQTLETRIKELEGTVREQNRILRNLARDTEKND
jgi:voltage-gated potassium channel